MDCGYNYRGKTQRGKNVYICGGYNNYKSDCSRYAIHENDLIDIIERHFKIHEIDIGDRPIKDYIKIIEVYNSKGGYIIKYKSGRESIFMPNHIKF